jgi:hypothetical protein
MRATERGARLEECSTPASNVIDDLSVPSAVEPRSLGLEELQAGLWHPHLHQSRPLRGGVPG